MDEVALLQPWNERDENNIRNLLNFTDIPQWDGFKTKKMEDIFDDKDLVSELNKLAIIPHLLYSSVVSFSKSKKQVNLSISYENR